MALDQNPRFPADKLADMLAAHATYAEKKNELFASVAKTTSGKANIIEDGIAAAKKWYVFVEENPDWITNKLKVAEFLFKLDAAELLAIVEGLESQDQGITKAMRDIIVSDLRFFWTTAESFYDAAADDDAIIKEKYKDLPSISPKRKSDTAVEKAFMKLEAKRNKKNGTTIPPTA